MFSGKIKIELLKYVKEKKTNKQKKIYRTLKENVFTVKEQQLYMEDVFQSRLLEHFRLRVSETWTEMSLIPLC